MKKYLFLPLVGIAMLLTASCAATADEDKTAPAQKTAQQAGQPAETATATTAQAPISQADIERVSETFGNFIGRNLKTPGMFFDIDSMIKGMREGFAGKPAPMNEKEYETLMAKIQEQSYKKMAEENLKAANEFMEKNGKADKVVEVVPGKLQYIILQAGHDPVVTTTDSPQIQYEGKFLDGTVFSSSSEAGGPITIPLTQTIPGFSKGLVGMKEGEKRKLFVHPDLGYGTTGHLPPNSLLIFEVEVIKANSPQTEEGDVVSLAELESDDVEDEEEDTDPENESDKE